MSFLPDDLKTQMFPCPACGHYINDEVDVCRHCNATITDEMRTTAIAKEQAERKKVFLGSEQQIITTGLVVLGVGVFNLLFQTFYFNIEYSSGFRIPCLSPIAIIVGIAITLHGVRGYLVEKRK